MAVTRAYLTDDERAALDRFRAVRDSAPVGAVMVYVVVPVARDVIDELGGLDAILKRVERGASRELLVDFRFDPPTTIEFVRPNDWQLHEIGLALAALEAAVMAEPDTFRIRTDHAHVIGDAAVMALAQRGFVVVPNAHAAAEVAAEYERSPEQAPKLQ